LKLKFCFTVKKCLPIIIDLMDPGHIKGMIGQSGETIVVKGPNKGLIAIF